MQQEWEKRFDKRFGKDGPDKDSDSIGVWAGCDDCSTNIKIRAEHKRFVAKELEARTEERKKLIGRLELAYRKALSKNFRRGIAHAINILKSK